MAERTMDHCCICDPEQKKPVKAIFTHEYGNPGRPICQSCNMRMRRESSTNEEAKRLKLLTTLFGNLEAMLVFDLEEQENKFFTSSQDHVRLLMRSWLGDATAEDTLNHKPQAKPAKTKTTELAAAD